MLEIPGFKGVKKIYWKDISVGMIIVDGIKINGSVPFELQNFPPITVALLKDLTSKYKLLNNKEVIVAYADSASSVQKMAFSMQKIEERIKAANNLRTNFQVERKKFISELELAPDELFLNSSAINQNIRIKDTFNSFEAKLTDSPIPSMFNRMEESINFADILSGRLKTKFNLPEDKEILLHLVVDYSYSMNTRDKLSLVLSTVHSFYNYLSESMLNLKIQLYVFSDECAVVKYPLSGKEIERRNTKYASFMKKVLHHNDKEVHNKIILFTDGEPSDREEALLNAGRLKKQKIDYTQIVFNIDDDRRNKVKGNFSEKEIIDGFAIGSDNLESYLLNDEEWAKEKEDIFYKFTEIAEACGGNQIIINVYELLNLVSFEVYDRYNGLLTLATSMPDEPPTDQMKKLIEPNNEKGIKPFLFKKL